MKTTEVLTEKQQQVVDYLIEHPDSNAEIIIEVTGISKLPAFKILKQLIEKDKIVINEQNTPSTYTILHQDLKGVKAEDKKTLKAKKTKQEDDEAPIKSGRSLTKFKFNGEFYGAGRLVLAVVRKYIEDNPKVTLTKLKEVFSDELQPRYGLIREESVAKKMSVDRDRYFLKPEDLIKVGGKSVAVCNQFGIHNLPIRHFRSLGFTIK